MKILLVDDDTQFTAIMARGFERRGFKTRSCSTADEAIAVCASFQPTHILLDLNMPEKSGLVALPQLLEQAPTAKLVVLTGYSSIATAVAATQAGATHYLCKPAGMEDILMAFGESQEMPMPTVPPDPISVERLEWEHIQKVLQDNDNNISATARALGMHRRTLQRKLQKRPVQH